MLLDPLVTSFQMKPCEQLNQCSQRTFRPLRHVITYSHRSFRPNRLSIVEAIRIDTYLVAATPFITREMKNRFEARVFIHTKVADCMLRSLFPECGQACHKNKTSRSPCGVTIHYLSQSWHVIKSLGFNVLCH